MDNFDNPLILAVETSGRLGSVALAQGDKLLSETCFSGPMRHSAEIFPAITGLLNKFDKKPDQIEQVYISAGPGSFTGLRIAVTFAKTLALANGAKIVAVDTLDVIAANVSPQLYVGGSNPSSVIETSPLGGQDEPGGFQYNEQLADCRAGLAPPILPAERLAVILDAKRGQFFIAVYDKTSHDLSRRSVAKTESRVTSDVSWHKILPDSLMTAEDFLAQFSDKPISHTGEG